MPKKGDIHVVPADGRWRVEVEGESGSLGTYETQAEAWEHAKKSAEQNRSEALLHGSDGQIRERSTYGHDPRSTPG